MLHIIDKLSDQEYKDGVLRTDRVFHSSLRFFTLIASKSHRLKSSQMYSRPLIQVSAVVGFFASLALALPLKLLPAVAFAANDDTLLKSPA